MKVTYINPFIDATRNLMEVMAGTKAFERLNLTADQKPKTSHDISAVIGISGDCTGSVVLSFSTEIALKIISSIVGETIETIDEDARDVVGEMVNIIAGNAITAMMSNDVGKLERSIPSIITGKGHKISRPGSMPCINIFFRTNLGDFAMQVSLKDK